MDSIKNPRNKKKRRKEVFGNVKQWMIFYNIVARIVMFSQIGKKDFTKHALKEHPRSAKALGKLVVAEEMYHQDEIYVPNEEKISKINPWIVSSMEKFLQYICPESGKCFKSKKKFVKHAITNYPVASRFLGELIIKEEIFDEIIDNDVEDYSGSGSGSSSGSSDDEYSDGYDSDDEDDRRRNTVLVQF